MFWTKRTLYAFLFLLVFMPLYWQPSFSYPLNSSIPAQLIFCFSAFAVIFCLYRRTVELRRRGWQGTLSILKNDYSFSEYASLNVLSFLYALVQGLVLSFLCLGYGFFVRQVFRMSTHSFQDWSWFLPSLYALGGSVLLLVLIRILIESYALFFSAAKGIQSYTDSSRQHY